MKRILSLLLSFTVGFLGMISMSAPAARAQTVASFSLSKLREQYEQLLAVERDPNTTPEVRERNHSFLEARRAQLADALRKRMDALRAYRASLVTTLTDEEKSAVEVSIRQIADELQSLQPPAAPAQGERSSRRPLRATETKQVFQQALYGGQPEKSDDRAAEKNPESRPAAENSEPHPAARAAARVDAIEITSPNADKTVHVGQIEVEVNVNDQDVDDLMVAVYTPASPKPLARTIELKRSDKGTKSFVVSLSKGENRIEVSDLNRPDVKAVRIITFTPFNAPNIGGAGSPDGAAAPIALSVSNQSCERGILKIKVDDTVKGPLKITATDSAKNPVEKFADQDTIRVARDAQAYQVHLFLNAADKPYKIKVEEDTDAADKASATLDWNVVPCMQQGEGHLTGLLLGGVVISQQAGKFSQADPFMGFNVGYSGRLRGTWRLHGHFQGIFQSEAKADAAPPKDVAIPDPTDFKTFLASRKAFDVEGQIYADWPLTFRFNRHSPTPRQVYIGPYFAWGVTTFMDKSELIGDDNVTVPNKDLGGSATATPTPTPTPGGAGSDTTVLDTTRAKIDNDLKSYRDLGFIINIFSDEGTGHARPTKLFLQALFAYGRYEGLAGLYNAGPNPGFWKDSRNRFVGKLRIFPSFLLDTNPDSKIPFMPMFGVELNAGRGPDQLKFFTGVAIPVGHAKPSNFQAADQGSGGDNGTKKTGDNGGGSKP